MINHGRTLLLNRDGATRPPLTFFLEEYVPADFGAVALPGGLALVHGRLMPPGADDAFANLMMRLYMQLLHSNELADDLLALDPRITYDLKRTVVATRSQTAFCPLTASARPYELDFVGGVEASLQAPQLRTEWILTAVGADRVKAVRVSTGETAYTDVTITDGETSPIDLPGQRNYKARVGGLPGALPVGAEWSAQTFVIPHIDASGVLTRLDTMGNEALIDLFPNREPYITYKKLWTDHVYAEYRLGGVLLAFVYRAEEERTGG